MSLTIVLHLCVPEEVIVPLECTLIILQLSVYLDLPVLFISTFLSSSLKCKIGSQKIATFYTLTKAKDWLRNKIKRIIIQACTVRLRYLLCCWKLSLSRRALGRAHRLSNSNKMIPSEPAYGVWYGTRQNAERGWSVGWHAIGQF